MFLGQFTGSRSQVIQYKQKLRSNYTEPSVSRFTDWEYKIQRIQQDCLPILHNGPGHTTSSEL